MIGRRQLKERGMRGRAALVMVILGIATLVTVAPSEAELRVCNKSTAKLDVAVGYDGGRQGWIAEGWWTIEVNKCSVVKGGDLDARYYYLYARADGGAEWDGTDGEGAPFCIKDEKFTLYQSRYGDNRDSACKKAGLYSQSFFQVDVGDYRRWTQTLDNGHAGPPAPAPNPAPSPNPPPSNGGNACQRYPNLC
jgi:uncharacterized membrane protein